MANKTIQDFSTNTSPNGNELFLMMLSGVTMNMALSTIKTFAISTLVDNNTFLTGGTYNDTSGTATYTNSTGGTFNVSGFYTGSTDDNTFVTGGTYTDGVATFTTNSGGTFTVTGFYTGSTDENTFVTGGTYSNGVATYTNNLGGTFNIGGFYTGTTDDNTFVTGGTYSNGTAEYTNNTGGTFNVSGFFTGSTDDNTFVTGGTYSNGSTTYTNNLGGTFNIDGFYTGSTDDNTFVTGGTFNQSSSIATFTNTTGGTFDVGGFYSAFYTGGTYDSSTGTVTFTNSTGGTYEITGFVSGLTDTNTFVTGGTLDNDEATFTNSTGGTFNVSGFNDVSNSIQDVFTGITANNKSGTNTTTTLQYGVNVVETVTVDDNASKLPQPVTGKSVKVVNKGSVVLSVYPNPMNPGYPIAGGQINNLPFGGSAQIPPDGKVYEFICIENPLPGAWTFNAPATSQYEIIEMTIPHTNGVESDGYGVGTVYPQSSMGISLGGNDYNISISTPDAWEHLLSDATAVKTKVYTNIVAGDIASGEAKVSRSVFYKTAYSSSSLFVARDYCTFEDSAPEPIDYPWLNKGDNIVKVVSGGTLSSPEVVGDNGTFYTEVSSGGHAQGTQLGTGGEYSGYYWTYYMSIPAAAVTKDYKFKIFVEYM